MKKIIAILLCIFWTNSVFSQHKIDEFTGDTLAHTKYSMLFAKGKGAAYVAVRSVNSTVILHMALMFPDRTFVTIERGDKLMLKLENGNILTLKAAETKISRRGGAQHGKLSGSNAEGLNVGYYVPDEEKESLKNAAIEKIRVYTSSGYIDYDIPKRNAWLIAKLIASVD